MSENIRHFNILHEDGTLSGRFTGKKPKTAAKKAFTTLMRKNKVNKLDFQIRECTRGSKCKTYKYTGERVKLDEPVEVKCSNDKVVKYYHTNKIYKKNNLLLS